MTTTGLFAKVNGSKVAQKVFITLWDYTDDGEAVWNVKTKGGEERFVEGHVDDDVWVIVDKAVRAFDEES